MTASVSKKVSGKAIYKRIENTKRKREINLIKSIAYPILAAVIVGVPACLLSALCASISLIPMISLQTAKTLGIILHVALGSFAISSVIFGSTGASLATYTMLKYGQKLKNLKQTNTWEPLGITPHNSTSNLHNKNKKRDREN